MGLQNLFYKKLRPSNSGAHYDKIKLEFHNLLNDLASAFNVFKQSARIDLYIRKLLAEDYTIEELERCVDHCMTNCKSFPNYPEILIVIGNCSTKTTDKKEEDDALIDVKTAALRTDTEHNLKMFLSKYPQEKLDEWLSRWFKEVYPKSDLVKFGVGLNMFLPIFFQDLIDGKNGIDGAIKQGKLKREGERN